jgi:hypothetical protein
VSEKLDQKPDPEAEAAVDALLAEFNGDARAAMKALLHDVDVLARDYHESVSRGFARSKRREPRAGVEPG